MASLRNEAIKGMAWSSFGNLSTQIIQFAIGIALARKLPPSDYGVIGMLAIFIALSGIILDSGFGSALIQKKDRNEDDYCTVFWFNVVVGICIYVGFYIAAPWIASFYNMPLLKSVTRVYTLTFIINSLCIVQRARFNIELNFKTPTVIGIVTTILTGVVGIVLAYSGYGVWALVFQALFSQVLSAILVWYFSKWRPKLLFSKKSFHHMFSFGSKIVVSSTINTIYMNLYTLIIGKMMSPADVGYYTRGQSYAILPSRTIQGILLRVNYPILAKIQDDRDRLIRAYNKMLSTPMFILYPILMGLIALGKPLIIVMIGEIWVPCVIVMQILCVGYMFSPLTHLNLNLLYVKGRTDLVLKLELIKKPIGFVLILITMHFGLTWMVIGAAVYEFIAFTFNCYYTGKLLDYGFIKQMKFLAPIILRSVMMALIVYFVQEFLDNNWLKLIMGFSVGVVSYFLMAYIMHDSALQDIVEIVKEKSKRKVNS